jgi:hypothetical protein
MRACARREARFRSEMQFTEVPAKARAFRLHQFGSRNPMRKRSGRSLVPGKRLAARSIRMFPCIGQFPGYRAEGQQRDQR